MSSHTYPRTLTAAGYDLGDALFAKNVREALLNHTISIACSGPECVVKAEPDLSAAEVAALDEVVAAISPWDILKKTRFKEVDVRTGELIDQGFEFPPTSGNIFSLSDHAQKNLLGMKTMMTDPLFTYPVKWNTRDDSSVYSILDEATAALFYATAVGTMRSHLDSGTAIKNQIRAATTEAEVLEVIDTR